MKLIKPSFEIIDKSAYPSMLEFIEHIGRVCYKSEDKIGSGTAEKFISRIIKSGHESVLEHSVHVFKITFESEREKEQTIKNINEIINNTIGFNWTNGHESVIISFNIRTLRDAKRRINNKLVNALVMKVGSQCPVLYRDLANK